MESNSRVFMLAVFICASYGNTIDITPHLNGNLDKDKETYIYSDNADSPLFSREHGNFEGGNV